MKKNKTVAYMLAATLLVGGTFAGTKALFEDTERAESKLILNTGKVDISVDDTQDWTRRDIDGIEKGTSPVSFDNVVPGETYVKYITIKNNSTYDVNLAVEEATTGIPADLKPFIKVEKATVKDLGKDEECDLRVSVSIDDTKAAWDALNGAAPIEITSLFGITATQAE